MSTDALSEQIRAQVRQALAAARPPAPATSAAPAAVVLPLRVDSAAGRKALNELLDRLSASPALLQAARAGLLRLDLRFGGTEGTLPAAASSAPSQASCCEACQSGRTCSCDSPSCSHEAAPPPAVTELKGVVGERQAKALAPGSRARLAAGAVLTPLGRDALRQRGITLEQGNKT